LSLRRRIAEVRLPDDLPIALGLLTAVLVCAWILVPVIAESALGRPSSTAGLGFFAGPVLGLLSGASAFLLAMGLRSIARRAGIPSVLVPPWLVALGVLAAAAAVTVLAFNARTHTIARESARRPRVIVESAQFIRSNQPSSGEDDRVEAPLLFSIYQEAVVPSIDWNGRAVMVSGSDEHVTILDKTGTLVASTDLHAFDYIGSIRAVPVCRTPNGDHRLAALVTLRATSKRSMLIVYGPNGAVVYQEHLERTGSGSGWAGTMYVGSRDGRDVLVVEHGPISAWTCPAG
jgi:hypothetical protein